MPRGLEEGYLDFATYLLTEREVERRSEYVDGQVYAMAGASETHNTIAGALYAQIEINLREVKTRCQRSIGSQQLC